MGGKRAVIAIGGNALIRDRFHATVKDQYRAMSETTNHIANLAVAGWELALTHGNGPQVGFILRRSELARHELHEIPLDVCGADTQGAIGYALQQNLVNDLRRMGDDTEVVSVVTQVEVHPDDPAWVHPAKPIGSFMDEELAAVRREEGWHVVEDAGRGWRRVVPSPAPTRIIEVEAIRRLLDAGFVVIAVGGGGVPVVRDVGGNLHGVEAVIDKDPASALLAAEIGADLLVITTGVEKVALDWGKPEQRWVDRLTVEEAEQYLLEGGHFGAGSMAPKVRACIEYLERGGDEVIITNAESLERAIDGETGTRIVP